MGCCEDGSCNCRHEITIEDIVQNNNIVLNTLIDLLVQKGLISEQELRLKLADVAKNIEKSSQKEEEVEQEIEENLEKLDLEETEESED